MELGDPAKEQVTVLDEQPQRIGLEALGRFTDDQPDVRGQRREDESLPIEERLALLVDPQHKLDPHARLDRRPADGPVGLGSRQPSTALLRALPGLAREPVHREVARVDVEERAEIRPEVVVGVGLGEPAQDELGRRQRRLERLESPRGCHRSASSSTSSAAP